VRQRTPRRLADTLPAFDSQHAGGSPRSKCFFDLLSTRGEDKFVWLIINHSVAEFYLFDRRSYGIGALEPTMYKHRPKLPSDTTVLHARKICSKTWLNTI
jgi:hypothetical protein